MRKFIILLLFALVIPNVSICQSSDFLNGYKYVLVALEDENIPNPKQLLNLISAREFGDLGLIVLTETDLTPDEVKTNPCLQIKCFYYSVEQQDYNDLRCIVIDCNNKMIWKGGGEFHSFVNYQFDSNKTPKLKE